MSDGSEGCEAQDEVSVRSMTDADVRAIHEIHTACLTRTLSAYYSSEQIAAWLKGRTPEGYLRAASGGEQFFVAEASGRVVGFASWQDDELLALFVHPDMQRGGVGGRLFEACMSDASGMGSAIVHVKAARGAEAFYRRRGFTATGQGSVTKHGVVIYDTRMVAALPQTSQPSVSAPPH